MLPRSVVAHKKLLLLLVFVLDQAGVVKLGDKVDFLGLMFIALWQSTWQKDLLCVSEEAEVEFQTET